MDLDLIAPRTVRSQGIVLALQNALVQPRAFTAIGITVSLTGDALANGLTLPLALTVVAPSSQVSGTPVYTHIFRRSVPTLLSYRPREGGQHAIVLRELTHQRAYGALQVSVQGDPLDVPD